MNQSKHSSHNLTVALISGILSLVILLLSLRNILGITFLIVNTLGILLIITSLYNATAYFIKLLSDHHQPRFKSRWLLPIIYITYGILFMGSSGVFWGKPNLEGTFIDDNSRMDITFYANGKYILTSDWILGREYYFGSYIMKNDTIIFDKLPLVDNDFIAQTIYFDSKAKKIYFLKNKDDLNNKLFYYFSVK